MSTTLLENATALKRYYRIHAKIYDVTRWSFLFGRQRIIKQLRATQPPKKILEVGCGTGRNLLSLAKNFPDAVITGVDLSSDMLEVASNKLELYSNRLNVLEQKYDTPLKDTDGLDEKYDLILFSYALSMFNRGWENAIKAAKSQLSQNGVIAVVDFHNSRFKYYRRWMKMNHVRMEGHILPLLEKHFSPENKKTINAYAGIWQYFMFVGKIKQYSED